MSGNKTFLTKKKILKLKIFFLGAGLSHSSGIPDFRTPKTG